MALNEENEFINSIIQRKQNKERITLGMIAEKIKELGLDEDTVWRGLIKAGIIPAQPEEINEEDYLASLYY